MKEYCAVCLRPLNKSNQDLKIIIRVGEDENYKACNTCAEMIRNDGMGQAKEAIRENLKNLRGYRAKKEKQEKKEAEEAQAELPF